MTEIFGVDLDSESRCSHYKARHDVVAIKFNCCKKWYACIDCHNATADHAVALWTPDQFDTAAIRCGVCNAKSTIRNYLDHFESCPFCDHEFNPGCERHHGLYFDITPKQS